MLNCYVHNDVEAMGTCVGCGKFICENCNTELKGKIIVKNVLMNYLKRITEKWRN